ncbi:MAG: DUF2911 domain-containing protein [Gemmatimonadetes bacterium]|jgi:hypothetical protein|nr:DUF2911 domain-containing protein [Gemmatimonadota bacterium]
MKTRTRIWRLSAVAVVCAGVAACGGLPNGKDRKSQPAMVRQRMGATELAVVYNRPAARGRKLFGGIVPYGQLWNPGADEATRLETNQDVRLNGQVLPAGKYSIWAIPQPGEWTLIFSRAHDVPHVPYPEGKDALRIRVRPEAGSHMESLGFSFPIATADSAVLTLQWGSVVVPIRIEPA